MKNLIICPVGMKIPTDPRWKDSDHWRWTNNPRSYDILVVSYNDFVPESGSYDYLMKHRGHKWQILRDLSLIVDFSEYKFIGCVDDDLITGYQDFNEGLRLAEKYDFKYWQLSMPSDSSLIYNCLFQDKSCTYSSTNFIEMGSCFFRYDYFIRLMEFIRGWDIQIGWGIDKTFYDLFQCPANVVHSACIHQPFRDSYYDKNMAMNEMNEYLYKIYPELIKKLYGRDSGFVDIQQVFSKFIEG